MKKLPKSIRCPYCEHSIYGHTGNGGECMAYNKKSGACGCNLSLIQELEGDH